MQFTFNIPNAHVPRIKAWIASRFVNVDPDGNPVPPPTDEELLAEFRQLVRDWIKGEVQQYELLKQHEDIFSQYTQIDVEDQP